MQIVIVKRYGNQYGYIVNLALDKMTSPNILNEEIMQNRFFIRAVAAAKQTPEAFAAEFNKSDANANAKEYWYWDGKEAVGTTLLHKLLYVASDENLPAILAILLKNHVNLEARELGIEEKPLTTAARLHKLNAVNFLLEHKVEVNDPKSPALCKVMQYDLGDISTRNIVKNLLAYKADIDMCLFGESPLFRATEHKLPETLSLLISQGANLFSRSSNSLHGVHTALSKAYEMNTMHEIEIKEGNPWMYRDHPFVKPTQKCFALLLQATKDFLYRQGMAFDGCDENLEVHLTKYIEDLSGDFHERDEVCSDTLKNLLVADVLQPVLTKIKADRNQRETARVEFGARLHSGNVRLWSFAKSDQEAVELPSPKPSFAMRA